MKKMNKLAIGLALALIGCNTQKQPSSPTLPEVSRWTGEYGGIDKSYDDQLFSLREEITPKFKQLSFTDTLTGRTMEYNLFTPENYDPNKQYPLVLFMADASTVGKGVIAPLKQGYGGIIWATNETQKEHPCFVLVPSYKGKEAATNDAYEVTDEVPTTYHLLQEVLNTYAIDRNRVYTTGQSMGGMISFYLNVHYPNLFAASLYAGTHWDFQQLKEVLPKQKFFYIASELDKAAPIMQQMETFFEQENIAYATTKFAANLPDKQKEEAIEKLLKKGADKNIVQFTKGTVLPNGFTKRAEAGEHMYAFDYAFQLKAVRDWLLSQHK